MTRFSKLTISSNSDKKMLFENFLSLGIIQVVSYVIPLISLPYLSRVLGVENFGRVFFAYAFMQYFIILTDFGFGLSAVKEIAQASDDKFQRDEKFNSVMFAKGILLLLSFCILVIIILCIPKFREDYLIYLFTFLMVVGNALFPVWFFQGIQHMKYITFINILSKVIFLILLFAIIKDSSQYIYVPLLNSMGFIIAGIIGIYIAKQRFKVRLYIPKMTDITSQLKTSAEFFLSRASASVITNTNSFALGIITSPLMVGFYTAAEKIYMAYDSLFAQVNNVMYPYIANTKNIVLWKKVLSISIIFNIVLCSFVVFFAKDIITIFYGAEMESAYKILQIFAIIILIKIPSTMMGYPLLAALGYTKVANFSVVAASFVHFLGLFLLIFTKNLNVYSLACMAGISESFICLYRFINVKKLKLLKQQEVT